MPPELNRCPLCLQPNLCAVAAGASAEIRCWCMDQIVPDAATLAAALPGTLERACLCRSCLRRLAQQSEIV